MPRCFEDLVVSEASRSEGRVISDEDVRAFAALTGDRNPLHLSDEAARRGGFGRRVAHGALVFSASIALLQADEARSPDIVAFLGVEKLRFVGPVFPGDTISVRTTIRSLDPVNAHEGMMQAAVEVLDQHETARLTYTAKFLVRRAAAVTG